MLARSSSSSHCVKSSRKSFRSGENVETRKFTLEIEKEAPGWGWTSTFSIKHRNDFLFPVLIEKWIFRFGICRLDWFKRQSLSSEVAESTAKQNKSAEGKSKTKMNVCWSLYDDKEILESTKDAREGKFISAIGLWKYWFLLLSLKTKTAREEKCEERAKRMKNFRE